MDGRKLIPLLVLLFVLFQEKAFALSTTRLLGHTPALSSNLDLGRKNSDDTVELAVVMNPRDTTALEQLISRQYDPNDSLYHKFLTPADFAANYAPTTDDINQVETYFTAQGLRVKEVHGNKLVLDIEGTSAAVENALQLELHNYTNAKGEALFGPQNNPALPTAIAGKVNSIVGLDNFVKQQTNFHKLEDNGVAAPQATNPTYTMTPAKIKSAYNMTSVPATGSGESIALFELDGYTASDIAAYGSYFSVSGPTLQNVYVDGYSGAAGSGAAEVTLDIELAMGLAPGVSKIIVYEGPNTGTGMIDTYSRIASDNLARQVSSSWGSLESNAGSYMRNAENTIFQEMASQGQSIFVAAGDAGADENGSSLSVLDPASQPYVTAVGGTTLKLGTNNVYGSETSWNPTNGDGGGGGGGVSAYWSIPSWQSGLATTANKGSSSMRMIPDVSLDANPTTGYSVYLNGAWNVYGGTSCAAPLWAAFAAIVNQTRIAGKLTPLGFANPQLYSVGNSSSYASAFHDINDGSNNLYYPAETGYDLSTGWGSFNGAGLYAALTGGAETTVTAPAAPTGLTIEVLE